MMIFPALSTGNGRIFVARATTIKITFDPFFAYGKNSLGIRYGIEATRLGNMPATLDLEFAMPYSSLCRDGTEKHYESR
jgi:hypothetical protein